MKSLERMVVGLSADQTDTGLVDYAFLLARLGIATQLDFVMWVHDREGDPEWAGEVRHALETTVRGQQTHATLSPNLSFNVLVGEREDQFCNYLETKGIGVILLGHRVHHSETLARSTVGDGFSGFRLDCAGEIGAANSQNLNPRRFLKSFCG